MATVPCPHCQRNVAVSEVIKLFGHVRCDYCGTTIALKPEQAALPALGVSVSEKIKGTDKAR
jgi:endogenous inhibitor of DNA gyrase (YacG/DUF329 family)